MYEVWDGDEFITRTDSWDEALRWLEAGYRVKGLFDEK